jgi:hypothetical protein
MEFVYTVIGIYEDDHTRFADDYAAANAAEAEACALADHPGLIVAGVLDMRGQIVA